MKDEQIIESISEYIELKYPGTIYSVIIVGNNEAHTTSNMDANLMIELFEEIVKEHKNTQITEPFKLPSSQDLIEIALLINNGITDTERIVKMVTMADIVIDRLYENQDVKNPCSKEGKEFQQDLDLIKHDRDIQLLEKYSLWLTKNEYMDTDWKDEEPYAIDQFIKENSK